MQPYASWLVSYQRYVYLPGTLLGVILLAGLAGMIVRRRVSGVQGPLPWAFAVTILLVAAALADFDLRYLVRRAARRLPGRGAGVRAGSGRGSAQVDDVACGHRDLGARGHPDQQPAVRVHADGRAG